MPQMARTDDQKPNAEIKAVGNRIADTARAVVDKGRDLARDVTETTASVVGQTAAKSAAVAEQVAGPMLRLAAETPAVKNDVTGFWRDLVQGQLADNVDAFRRLAAAGTWQERLDIQSNYVTGNLTRMGDAASRCVELTGSMMTRLLPTGSGEAKKAA